jgi:phage FluMu protein Com
MLKNEIQCPICGKSLIIVKGVYTSPKCPSCDKIHVVPIQDAIKLYQAKISDLEFELIGLNAYTSFEKMILYLLILRELRSQGQNPFEWEKRSDGTVITSYYQFILAELAIRAQFNSHEWKKGALTPNHESFFTWIKQYHQVNIFLSRLQQENACYVKIGEEYYEAIYLHYEKLLSSLEDFGIGRSDADHAKLAHQAFVMDITFEGQLYEFSRILVFANLYIYLPEAMKSYLSMDISYELNSGVELTRGLEHDIEKMKNINFEILRKIILFWLDKVEDNKIGDFPIGQIPYLQFRSITVNYIEQELQIHSNPQLLFEFLVEPFIFSSSNRTHAAIFLFDIETKLVYFGKNSLDTFAKIIEIRNIYNNLREISNQKMDHYFRNLVIEILNNHQYITSDLSNPPISLYELQTKKNGPEWDIMAIKEERLLIFEIKAFHPSINFELNHAKRRRDSRLNNFFKKFFQIDGILNWVSNNVRNNYPSNGIIRIRRSHKKENEDQNLQLKLPTDLKIKEIIPIYLNQLREIPDQLGKSMNILCIDDLDEFLESKNYFYY